MSFFVLTAAWDKILMSDNMTSKLGWGVHGCGLWRGIHMGWETFSKNTRFEIRVGNRVKFWQDWWCGDQPLQLAFRFCMRFPMIEDFVDHPLRR